MAGLAFHVYEPEDCDSQKAPIIFLHGVCGSKEMFNDLPTVIANATKRKTYAIDFHNHGDSAWMDNFTFDTNVGDLLEFMDAKGIKKAVPVGCSMGGIATMYAAVKKPDRFEKIVVVDVPASKLPSHMLDKVLMMQLAGQTAIQQAPPELDERQTIQFVADFLYQSLPPDIKKNMPRPKPGTLQLALKKNAEGRWEMKANMKELYSAVERYKNAEFVPLDGHYDGPALFVYGKLSDFKVNEDEENIRIHFPNVELVGIENANHAVFLDNPEDFNQTLIPFLNK